MSTNTHNARLPIPSHLRFSCGLILAVAGSIPCSAGAEPPQNGKGQPPVQVPNQQQRDQSYDDIQQQRDQMRRDESLRGSFNQVLSIQEESRQRALFQQLLRENFRNHYKTLRVDADKLAQLALALQTYVSSNSDPGLPRDQRAQAASLEKLAHEIRTTLAGSPLPRMKRVRSAGGTASVDATSAIDARQLLLQRVNASSDLAGIIKQATEQYMANNNEHAVSVDALKNAADKTKIDQRLVFIMNSCEQLERIAYDLRTMPKTVSEPRAVSAAR